MTTVEIRGDDFWIDGEPTYQGRIWRGHRIEGLLFNSRMVQATFDDLNPDTRPLWAYPDTGVWDADRNVEEFLEMVPEYRRHGLLAVTINLQGGNPRGYTRVQPWINTAFTASGELRPEYMMRVRRVLDGLDAAGMVAIVGLFYFGQDERLLDEGAVRRAVDNAVNWLLQGAWRNVILEINNECDVPLYEHEILQPHRVHELIEQAKSISWQGRRLPVGTSWAFMERVGPWARATGRRLPPAWDIPSVPREKALEVSDVALIHGNLLHDPRDVGEAVAQIRALMKDRPIPIVFNEDDHFAFDQPVNNLLMAVQHQASWGYYDAGPGSGGRPAASDYVEGFQNVPVNWRINTGTKRGFFGLIKEMTGS